MKIRNMLSDTNFKETRVRTAKRLLDYEYPDGSHPTGTALRVHAKRCSQSARTKRYLEDVQRTHGLCSEHFLENTTVPRDRMDPKDLTVPRDRMDLCVAEILVANALLELPMFFHSTFQMKVMTQEERTEYLNIWFFDHTDHPYPSPEEKEKMAKETGMTFTQLNDWMSNSRRRKLKHKRI